MALRRRIVKQIALGKLGINLSDAVEDVRPGQALLMQNCYFRRGIQTKLGSLKHSSNQVATSKKIVGLHRFYYGSESKKLIAAAGTNVAYMDDGTGAWTNLKTDRTDGAPGYMTTWSALNKMYFANGVDAPFIWDGTTVSAASAFPTDTIMFLPYRSRLLYIQKTQPSYLMHTSSDYVDNAVIGNADSIRIVGGGQIQVIASHALAGSQEGIQAMVFVATASSCALFSATDFTIATGNRKLDHVSDTVGTLSPRSVVLTPHGTVFLGSDRQVYLLPFGTSKLEPIGQKIRSTSTGTYGIENIPIAQLPNACAAYHDGFYKLSITIPGGTTNTRQYWLDIDNLSRDEEGHYGPWYGPMLGMSINCFVVQNGSGDDGRLLGGNANATGYVYRMNEAATYADDGSTITAIYQSFHERFGTANSGREFLDKRLTQSELLMVPVSGTVTMRFSDTVGAVGSDVVISPSSGIGNYYGVIYYGEEYYYDNVIPKRFVIQHFDNNLEGRTFATTVEYTSSTDALNLLGIQHEAKSLNRTFAGA